MSLYDAPNQQVVRADGSGPWEEGNGGSGGQAPAPIRPKGAKPEKENDHAEKAEESG
jgi:hypothetical protein